MKIALDVSPLESRFLAHRVRGTGFYVKNLKNALEKYYSQNEYTFFTRGQKILESVDLVHYPFFEPYFLTLPLSQPFPVVVTVHDLTPLVFPKHFPAGVRGKLKWEVQKIALKGAKAVIADSEASKNDIIKHAQLAPNKVFVVYLASSESFNSRKSKAAVDEVRKKYGLPDKFILYVGDVTWNKNLPMLISAIKKINLTMVMVGSALVAKEFDRSNPWNQDIVTVQKQAEGDSRIIRLGFVPSEDLPLVYQAATVFAMPSIYEGFGLPILEAMASGIPVVTSRGGSIPEVAGDAAFYVDEYDVESIANGIGEVFFTKQLQQDLVEKGDENVKKFSWKKTVEATIQVYEWALKGGE